MSHTHTKSKFFSKTNKNPFLTIPFQSFEIENTHILPPQVDFKDRTYFQLCYKDSSVEIQDVPILTPPLKVHHYDIKKSMLFLEIDPSHPFYQKIHRFQEHIIQTFYNYQNLLLANSIDNTIELAQDPKNIKIFLSSQNYSNQPKNIPLQAIRSYFQMPLRENIFGLYIHPNTEIKLGGTQTPIQAYQLLPGTFIRALLRFYNILCVKSPFLDKNYLRIQHSVPIVWYIGPPKILNRNHHGNYVANQDSEKCLIVA